MVSYPLCLPIQARTRAEVLKIIDTHPSYPFFEVWLGAIDDLDDAFVGHIASLVESKLIVLFRTKNLEIRLPLEQRLFFLRELSNSSSFVDLDIKVQREELEFAKSNNLTLNKIISYHNYDETPPGEVLQALSNEMTGYQPAIIKFSTYCNVPTDAMRILSLGLELRSQGHRAVTLGMGEHGVVTRIFGTLWGNALVFAPQNRDSSSAPGQLTESELISILSALNPKGGTAP